MDFTGIDIAALLTSFGAFFKGFLSDARASKAESKANDIEVQRSEAKLERDKEIQELKRQLSVLEAKSEWSDKRLKEGDEHFIRVENELKETNGLLRELLGRINYELSKKPNAGC